MESDKIANNIEGKDHDFLTRVVKPNECQEVFNILENDFHRWTFKRFKMYSEEFPSSVFVTIKVDTREVVAAVSTFPTSRGQNVIGVLIVRPDLRRKGLASALLNHVITKSALQRATFALLSKPELETMYSKAGFQETTPAQHRFTMIPDKVRLHKKLSNYDIDGIKIVSYTPDLFQALSDYDTEFRGYDIRTFLSVMLNSSSSFFVAISKSSGRIVGHVSGLKTCSYLLIDGLYADDDGIAIQLFSKLVDAFPDKTPIEFITINPPDILTQFSMNDRPIVSKSFTRFATGSTAPIHLTKAFAVMDYTG